MIRQALGCLFTLTAMGPIGAWAAPITVLNSGFESTRVVAGNTPFTIPDGSFFRLDGSGGGALTNVVGTYSLDNWTLLAGTPSRVALQNSLNAHFTGATGVDDNILLLGNSPEAPSFQVVGQTLSATLQPNTLYTLSVDVGQRLDFGNRGYELALYAGTTELERIKSSDLGATAIPVGTMATIDLVVNANDFPTLFGQALQIRLSSLQSLSIGGGQTAFDNVQLDAAPTPEPAAICLWLILGSVAIGCAARRRRK